MTAANLDATYVVGLLTVVGHASPYDPQSGDRTMMHHALTDIHHPRDNLTKRGHLTPRFYSKHHEYSFQALHTWTNESCSTTK